jgi:hypothetical protein
MIEPKYFQDDVALNGSRFQSQGPGLKTIIEPGRLLAPPAGKYKDSREHTYPSSVPGCPVHF